MTGLHTEIYGTGESLVLVHGWAMHTGVWINFATNLAKQYEVICVDLPGHGQSASGAFVLDQVVDELSRVIPEHPCCWLGWSMGAAIVLEMARKYPHRVTSLVLLAGSPCFVEEQDWPGISRQKLDLFRRYLYIQPRATLARFLALQVQGEPNSRSLHKSLQKALVQCPTPDNKILLGGLEVLSQTDLRTTLARLNIPVLVCLGENDLLVPAAAGNAILRLLPEAEIMIVNEAGHLLFLSREQEVVNRIFSFIEQH